MAFKTVSCVIIYWNQDIKTNKISLPWSQLTLIGSPIVRVTGCLNGGTLAIDPDGIRCECVGELGGKYCERGTAPITWKYIFLYLDQVSNSKPYFQAAGHQHVSYTYNLLEIFISCSVSYFHSYM